MYLGHALSLSGYDIDLKFEAYLIQFTMPVRQSENQTVRVN